MKGFITEQQFDEAEEAFPGIGLLYCLLAHKPVTFLELVWEWQARFAAHCDHALPAAA